MDITIAPRLLKGRITPPPSKSQAHRALIAAALAGGGSRIENLADSQDIQATSRCLAACARPAAACLCWTAGNPAPPCAFSSPFPWSSGEAAVLPAAGG